MPIFKVYFEESINRETWVEVVAPDDTFIEDKELRDGLEIIAVDSDWDEESWGVEMGRIQEVDKEEMGAYLFISEDGSRFTAEHEYEEHEKERLEEEAEKSPNPLPGQLGIKGIGKNIPR